MAREISRRYLLLGGLTLGIPAVLAKPLGLWNLLVQVTGSDSLATRLAALTPHEASAKVVGGEYLRVTSHERSAPALTGAVASSLGGGYEAQRACSSSELRDLVRLRIQRDFTDGDIVNLQGWIMSKTEARLCALVALAGRRGVSGPLT